MKILEGINQGSEQWHAERARRFTASEAPAMMGVSKYTSRSALLHQKATGIVPEVSAHQQALFDRGHAAEAAAREIVEEMIGEPLFPVTAVHEAIDWLLASLDGATMTEERIMEHKLWSEPLAAQVRAQDLEPHYYFQLEQQLLVSGADVCIFVCSDGTREKFVSMEYRPVPGRREALLDGWEQFRADLAAYVVPTERAPEPVAAKKASLPALVVDVEGKVVQSNLQEWKLAAISHIETINTSLVSDQDFADADEAVKWCESSKKRLEEVKAAALARMTSVEALFSAIDEIVGTMDSKRKALSKLVEARKEARKTEIVEKGRRDLAAHIVAKEQALRDLMPEGTVFRGDLMPSIVADFGGAIKGKRSFANMESAVSDEVARCKVEANKACELREKNLKALQVKAAAHKHLFADWRDLIGKDAELVELTIGQRIQAEKDAEERRLEAERARIRTEEEARARAAAAREQQEREAAERREREEQEAAARAEQQRQQDEERALRQANAVTTAREIADIAARAGEPMPDNVRPMPTRAPTAAPAPRTLTATAIAQRLGFALSVAFIADKLGVAGEKEGPATKFSEPEYDRICSALIAHVTNCLQKKAA